MKLLQDKYLPKTILTDKNGKILEHGSFVSYNRDKNCIYLTHNSGEEFPFGGFCKNAVAILIPKEYNNYSYNYSSSQLELCSSITAQYDLYWALNNYISLQDKYQ